MFASDAELEEDPETYNCEACPVADALADLESDTANAHAWRVFQQVFTRLTCDTHVSGAVLMKLVGDLETDAFADLLQRFTILYDTLSPPPEPRGSNGA